MLIILMNFINVVVVVLLSDENPLAMFVVTEHGGHLGYYESLGLFKISEITWMDKAILQYILAVMCVKSAQRSNPS